MTKLTTLPFHDATLFAVEEAGTVRVAVKPIADALGLAWNKQLARIKRDPVLAEGMTMTVIPSAGGAQETTVLRLDLLPGWLAGVDAARVKPEARALVLTYRRECFAVLHRHFFGEARSSAPPADVALHPPPGREETVSVRRGLVTEARHVFGTRAAGALWFALGLPTVPEMRAPPVQGSFGFTYTATPIAPARA